MMQEREINLTIISGLHFPESPRWHDGALWCSDMHGRRVWRYTMNGDFQPVCELHDDYPSGLGWLPDGRLLVVAMESRQIRRLEPDGSMVVHADLSHLALGDCNDMVVHSDGTAWLGDMAYKVHSGEYPSGPGHTIQVSPEGIARIAAGDLIAPNGHAITEDGKTLVVAESGRFCLTAFDIAATGQLTKRRVFAAIEPEQDVDFAPPDGVCLDVEGGAWFADPIGRRVCRILEGGVITDVIRYGDKGVPTACVLGGEDRRTLFITVSMRMPDSETLPKTNGRIDTVKVTVSGSGRP